MHWHLLLEEFGPIFEYKEGVEKVSDKKWSNVVAISYAIC